MKLQLKLSFAEGEIDEPSIAFGSGWADPEAVGRWALEGESLLHLPALAAASDFDLKLTVWPMLVPGLVTAQRVSAQFNGVEVGSAVVSRQEPTELRFVLPREACRSDGPNRLRLRHPDAAAPSDYESGSSDPRKLGLLYLSGVLSGAGSAGTLAGPHRMLFVVTAVCAPGGSVNPELVRFLHGQDCDVLVWVDFLDPRDCGRVAETFEAEFPGVVIRAAPRALWGGGSIVQSMLQALAAGESLPDWTHAIFTSAEDVPLKPRMRLLAVTKSLAAHDFVSSRWTQETDAVVKPAEFRIAASEDPDTFVEHVFRPTSHIRVAAAIADLCTDTLVNNGRMTRTLSDRYSIAATEDFAARSLVLRPLSPGRASDRAAFFARFPFVAGRMWVFLSRRLARRLTGLEAFDWFQDGFRDLLIPDECFFQSAAEYLSRRDEAHVRWTSLQYNNADPCVVDRHWYPRIIETAGANEIFARKAAGIVDYAAYFDR